MALHNVGQTFSKLRKKPDDVVINAMQAAEIWKVFRGYPIDPARLERLEYKAFLQAAMMGAIDGSAAVGFMEALFKSAYKPNSSVKKIIKALLKEALKQYYRKRNDTGKLYTMVIRAIAYGNKFYFDCIGQGIDI